MSSEILLLKCRLICRILDFMRLKSRQMCLSCLYFPFPCVYREEDTPSSIPNLAVKLLFADDTALCKCGNVGRCRDWGNIYLTHKILLYLLLLFFILLYLLYFLSCFTLPYSLSCIVFLSCFTFYLALSYFNLIVKTCLCNLNTCEKDDFGQSVCKCTI